VTFLFALAVAALSGFLALAYEILWYRAFSFANASSPTTFGLLLAFYLAGLALGSLATRRFCDTNRTTGDPRQLRALAGFVFFAQVAAFLVIPMLAWCVTRYTWVHALAAVAVAAMLLGAALPLVAHFGIAPDDKAGARLSYVYLANIVGSAAGSLVVGFVLLDRWPMAKVSTALALSGYAVVFVLIVASRAHVVYTAGLSALLAVAVDGTRLATPVLFDRLYEKLQFKKTLGEGFRFAEVVETKSGVITVTPGGEVYGGGAYDGIFNAGLAHDRNGIFRTYAVGAMRPEAKSALMIGLASGSWAQVVASFPKMEHLTIVEINPGYAKILASRPEVSWLLTNPRITIVYDDGRRWMLRHPERKFDLLVMNTTWHWRAHCTNLLSAEFMQLARAHLNPGGLFFFNTTHSEEVLATGARMWPYAMRVYNCMAASDAPITLEKDAWKSFVSNFYIQGKRVLDPEDDGDRAVIDELASYPDTLNQPPDREGLESRESLLGRLSRAKTVTDDNMASEWHDQLSVQLAR
jgi:spermidine synthase